MLINNYKMNKQITNRRDLYCINCGKNGHIFKSCKEPITSYGVILVSLNLDDLLKNKLITELNVNCIIDKILNMNEDIGIVINDFTDIELFCEIKNCIKFLLIRRKHTLGFLEFVRGRYNIDNIDGIIFLFKQMTPEEINKIKLWHFDELWDDVWGENKHKLSYQTEYALSKDKFNKLKNEDNGFLNLDFYIENVTPSWEFAEWGFPKGRRNINEEDMSCAIREFKEESGYDETDFLLLDKIQPIEEVLIGTNGINYKHIYYISISMSNKIPSINEKNINQIHEIGDIMYFTYEEAIKIIRPYHTERQKLLTQLYIHVMNSLINSIKLLKNGK